MKENNLKASNSSCHRTSTNEVCQIEIVLHFLWQLMSGDTEPAWNQAIQTSEAGTAFFEYLAFIQGVFDMHIRIDQLGISL